MCSRRAARPDGRYGENPNRLQHYYQYQVILKPNPPNLQELYLGSLAAIGLDPLLHDIRFVEDDWESPTLGAWGLGWECWCDGMEVSQFTYFQQVCGIECSPVAGELTYGLERLAMYVQGVDNVYDLNFNGREGDEKITYGDVFLQAEQEYSRHNFEFANTAMLHRHFIDAEKECQALLARRRARRQRQPARCTNACLPAYDQCIKASHVFNLLDARGVISVTERQSYILRVRTLAKACGEAFLLTDGGWGRSGENRRFRVAVSGVQRFDSTRYTHRTRHFLDKEVRRDGQREEQESTALILNDPRRSFLRTSIPIVQNENMETAHPAVSGLFASRVIDRPGRG